MYHSGRASTRFQSLSPCSWILPKDSTSVLGSPHSYPLSAKEWLDLPEGAHGYSCWLGGDVPDWWQYSLALLWEMKAGCCSSCGPRPALTAGIPPSLPPSRRPKWCTWDLHRQWWPRGQCRQTHCNPATLPLYAHGEESTRPINPCPVYQDFGLLT